MADELISSSMQPTALAGIVLRALPRSVLERPFAAATGQLMRRHPALFERLEGFADADIVIEASDLGIGVRVWPAYSPPRIELVTVPSTSTAPQARIRGPLAVLIGLLEGRLDGDAMFFSRDLSIEGDTELVLALRNSIESAEIDLVDDLLAPLAPVDLVARRVLDGCGGLARHGARHLERVRATLGFSTPGSHDRLVHEIRELEKAVASVQENLRHLKAGGRGGARAKP